MLNTGITTRLDRQAIKNFVGDDPRAVIAIETALNTVQDTPEAVNQAQATANQAVLDAGAAQGTANTALANAATAQATGSAAQVTANSAQFDANALETALQSPTAANLAYIGPASGSPAAPTFRALVQADLPALATPPNFSVSRNTSQSIATSTFTKVQFATAAWNVGSCFDPTTNFRFTPNVAGKFMLTAAVNFGLSTASTPAVIVSIFKNGSEFKRGAQLAYASGAGNTITASVSAIGDANGTTDYFEVFAFQSTGAGETINGGAVLTWFQGAWVAA